MKPITTQYLESAVQFFKRKFGIDKVDCGFKFEPFQKGYRKIPKEYLALFPITLGYYDPFTNTIGINGIDQRSRNELVETMFHELAHWWQHKIVGTLEILRVPPQSCGCGDCNDVVTEKSVLDDYYHQYTRPLSPYARKKVFYNKIDTTSIIYWDKPYEVEARKMAEELFKEWNQPEHKGKCNPTK